MTQWLLLHCCLLGVACLDRPRPGWPRRHLRGAPNSSSGRFTPRPGEDRGSCPQHIQLPCKQQLQTCTCCFPTGWWRQRLSGVPLTLGWQFRSRSLEGSIFSPHHHVKQVHVSLLVLVVLISSPVNRLDTTAVGWGLLDREILTPLSLAPQKLILHHHFHFYCSKRTARLRHNLRHTVLSHSSLCRNVGGNTKSLLPS